MRTPPAFLVLAALAAAMVGCGDRLSSGDFNLVLVSLDTMRADRLGAYGYAGAATPALDRLAAEGVRFADVTAPAPLTLPSHATLLSGVLPPRHGLRNNGVGSFPAGLDTLATRLAAAGCRTAGFVGAFVLDRRFGLDRGFDLYDGVIELEGADEALRLESERRAEEVVDRALAWLGDQDGQRFFLWVHLYDAHAPYAAPEPWRSRFAERPYDGEVAYVDAQVGRLLAALEDGGMAAGTVVAVVGDHGESLGEHGERRHGLLLHQAAVAVPWILRAPGLIDAGRAVATPVSLADVAPTLAALLGVELGELDGRDLSPALRRGGEPEVAALYAETEYPALFGWASLAALRRGPLKLVDSPQPELYDVVADPAEEHDLAAERRREFRELRTLLEEIRARGAAPASVPAVDAETRERLAALGYAAGLPPREAGEGAHPRDRIALFHAWEDARAVLERRNPEEMKTAVASLRRVVAADPANPVFRGGLALAYRRTGDLERAVELYREVVAAVPHDPEAWQNLAATLREAGRPREAVAAAKEALLRDPERPEAHNHLGLAYLAEGDLETARRDLERSLELNPMDAAVWNNLGNLLRTLGEPTAAEDAFRRSLELSPSFALPLNGLGALLVEIDRPREALSYFERALALDPRLHEARLNRGIALELAGDGEGAAAAYRDFLAHTEGNSEFLPQREVATALLARISD